MDGDIQLLENTITDGDPQEPPYLLHRRKIYELKRYGVIVCFEAKVSPANGTKIFDFTVKLIHDPEISNKLGEILLMLTIRSLE